MFSNYTELRTIRGQFLHLRCDNELLVKNDENYDIFNLVNGTVTSRKADSNLIFENMILNGQIIEFEFSWKYENGIVMIIDKNNKIIKKFRNNGFDFVEVVKPLVFHHFHCLIVIFSSPEKTLFLIIKTPTELDSEGKANYEVIQYDSFRKFEIDDETSGLMFESIQLGKQFVHTKSNEIITSSEGIFQTRKISPNCILNTTFSGGMIEFRGIDNEEKFHFKTNYLYLSSITPFAATKIGKRIYLVDKTRLSIIVEGKDPIRVDLNQEEPKYSVISVDARFIGLVYHDRVKILTNDSNLRNDQRSVILSNPTNIYSLSKNVRIYNDHYEFWANSEVLKKHSKTFKNSLEDCPDNQIFVDNNIDLRALEKIFEKIQIDSNEYLREYFEIY